MGKGRQRKAKRARTHSNAGPDHGDSRTGDQDTSPGAGRELLRELAPGVLFLMAAVVIAYLPAIDGGFIWDDPEYVINNPTLRSPGGLSRIWFSIRPVEGEAFRLKCDTPQYYPLVFTTFWIEYQLYGLKAGGYHLINVLLHAGCAILLWRLLRRLGVPGAFAAAALFGLHPVHVESVAWITERKNVLSLFFYLASAMVYLRLALPCPPEKEAAFPPKPGNTRLLYALSFVLFVFALLSKTVTSSLPAALLLVLWWKKKRLTWRDGIPLLPFFAVGIMFGLMTVYMEQTHVGARGDEWSLSFLERCLLAGRIPWFYAWKLAWPMNLIFIYPRWEISAHAFQQYLFPLATIVVIAVLFIHRKRLGRGPLTALLFFIGSLFPALGFFNVYPMRFSFVADHFQYLASLGLIVPAAALGATALGKLGYRKGPAVVIPLIAAAGILGALTWKQGRIYKNQETLWEDTLAKNPEAWIAHSNLAEILVSKGRIDEAIHHCMEALKGKKDLPEALGNLANALYYKKRYAEAVTRYHEVLRLDPDNLKAMNNLAATLEAQGKLDEAVEKYLEVLGRDPNYASAHHNLANVYSKQKRLEDARRHYESAVDLNPGFLKAHYKLGQLLRKLGEEAAASRHLQSALHLARSQGDSRLVQEIEALLDRSP